MKISQKSAKFLVYLGFVIQSLLLNVLLGKYVQQFVPHSSVFEKLIFGVAGLLFVSAVITSIGGLVLFADDRFNSKPFMPWLSASLIVAPLAALLSPVVTVIAYVAFVICLATGFIAFSVLVGAAVAMGAVAKLRALVATNNSPEFAMEGKSVS